MGVEIHQRGVTRKIIIHGVNAKVGVGNGGARHIQRVNDLLKVRGGTIRGDVISENDERLDGGKKSKTHCIFNQKEPMNHMTTIMSHDYQQTIVNRSKNDHRTTDQKPIQERS